MNISSITRFIRNNLYIAFAFAVGALLELRVSKMVGEIVAAAIIFIVNTYRKNIESKKKKHVTEYLESKYDKDLTVIKLTKEEDGMWIAECKAVDDERYFDDITFQVQIDSWRDEIWDNLKEKEEEHFESYSYYQESEM